MNTTKTTGQHRLGLTAASAVGAAAIALTLTAGASAAFAAGSGYGSGTPGAPGQTGNYSGVASVQTVPASGGTVTATVDGATVSVTVPAGYFTAPVQIVFLSATNPTGGYTGTVELAFGVQVDQNGTKLSASFTYPITVTVTDPAITAGSTVTYLSGTSFVAASGWTTSAGQATGSFSVDIDYLITAPPAASSGSPAAGTAVPGATTAVTGKPFMAEGLFSVGLVGLGSLGLWRRRRVQRSAAA